MDLVNSLRNSLGWDFTAFLKVSAHFCVHCLYILQILYMLTLFQGVSNDLLLVHVVTWRGKRGLTFKGLSLLLCIIRII